MVFEVWTYNLIQSIQTRHCYLNPNDLTELAGNVMIAIFTTWTDS